MSPESVRNPSTRRTARIAMIVGVPLLAVITAACGSSSSASSTGSGGGTSPTTPPSGQSLAVADTSLGAVLVDGNGMTVYMLTADSPGKSSCATQCLVYWPAVSVAGTPTVGSGVVAKVGQGTTPDGAPILTAGGWPLYTYVQDHAPGDVTGEGVQSFGGTWYALSPDGQPVKATASSSGRSY